MKENCKSFKERENNKKKNKNKNSEFRKIVL